MGIQNQSRAAYRFTRHHIKAGIIGKIKKVYVWSFKNWDMMASHSPKNLSCLVARLESLARHGAGSTLHRESLSPWSVAEDSGFRLRHLGDMGIHIFDTPFKSLNLIDPLWVEAECRAPNGFGHAETNKLHYGFAPTNTPIISPSLGGTVKGSHNGSPDLQLPNGGKLPRQGALYVGEAGRMVLPHGNGYPIPTFYPDSVLDGVNKKEFNDVNHYTQFLDAIEGKDTTLAGFDYAGPLAESLCLGVVACQFPGKRLKWDAKKMPYQPRPSQPAAQRRVPGVLVAHPNRLSVGGPRLTGCSGQNHGPSNPSLLRPPKSSIFACRLQIRCWVPVISSWHRIIHQRYCIWKPMPACGSGSVVTTPARYQTGFATASAISAN